MGKNETVGGNGFILIFNENAFLDFYSKIAFKLFVYEENVFNFVS